MLSICSCRCDGPPLPTPPPPPPPPHLLHHRHLHLSPPPPPPSCRWRRRRTTSKQSHRTTETPSCSQRSSGSSSPCTTCRCALGTLLGRRASHAHSPTAHPAPPPSPQVHPPRPRPPEEANLRLAGDGPPPPPPPPPAPPAASSTSHLLRLAGRSRLKPPRDGDDGVRALAGLRLRLDDGTGASRRQRDECGDGARRCQGCDLNVLIKLAISRAWVAAVAASPFSGFGPSGGGKARRHGLFVSRWRLRCRGLTSSLPSTAPLSSLGRGCS